MEHSEFTKLKSELMAGDLRSLALIFKTHSSFCISHLQHKHQCSQQDAEDIFADAIINLREKVVNEQLNGIVDLRAYLFGTCKNMLMENVRYAKRCNAVACEMRGQFQEDAYATETTITDKENLLTLTEQALHATPNPCKQLLLMFYFDKLNLEQIANRLGFANANVAKASKSRCFKKLAAHVRTLQMKSTYQSLE